jgi:hypothetical protein
MRGTWPGSVGAIGWICSPHCWQYAKPIGVEVPHRGHVIVLPCTRAAIGIGAGVASGPGGGIADGMPGSGIGIGAPWPGAVGAIGSGAIGSGIGAIAGVIGPSADPHARQNFMPGGFSPWHTPQMMGNPALGAGVC